jgi:PAS domain S-box-containing protein
MLDIYTLSLVLSVTNAVQVASLFSQYAMNRNRSGLLCWALGSASMALAFAFNFLRGNPSFALFSIVANNAFFVGSLSLLYAGVLRFMGRRENRAGLILLPAVTAALAFYFSYVDDNSAIRRIGISLVMTVLSIFLVRALIKYRTPEISSSVVFLSAVFASHGFFWGIRGLSPFFGPVGDFFAPSMLATVTYLAMLILSSLWTFGFILMVNERLNRENREDNENLELIFNTSPDAVLITRLSDGLFVKVNEGFTRLSGYARADVIGKSILDFDIWENSEDRERLIEELRDKGFCEKMEVTLHHKNGGLHYGILSARVLALEGVPHLITVAHDITERKESELKVRELFHQLEVEKSFAEKSAMTDGLTSLPNRRYFDLVLNTEFFRLRRSKQPLSLIILDIDHFKNFNDRYGHVAGMSACVSWRIPFTRSSPAHPILSPVTAAKNSFSFCPIPTGRERPILRNGPGMRLKPSVFPTPIHPARR